MFDFTDAPVWAQHMLYASTALAIGLLTGWRLTQCTVMRFRTGSESVRSILLGPHTAQIEANRLAIRQLREDVTHLLQMHQQMHEENTRHLLAILERLR